MGLLVLALFAIGVVRGVFTGVGKGGGVELAKSLELVHKSVGEIECLFKEEIEWICFVCGTTGTIAFFVGHWCFLQEVD